MGYLVLMVVILALGMIGLFLVKEPEESSQGTSREASDNKEHHTNAATQAEVAHTATDSRWMDEEKLAKAIIKAQQEAAEIANKELHLITGVGWMDAGIRLVQEFLGLIVFALLLVLMCLIWLLILKNVFDINF
jgi:Flp pilus assembly protein TadB